jgi:hypothetical protein
MSAVLRAFGSFDIFQSRNERYTDKVVAGLAVVIAILIFRFGLTKMVQRSNV